MLAPIARSILLALAPARCAGCDAVLARDAAFCAGCVATLEPPPPQPRGVTASFAYGGALADAIRAVKYRRRVDRLRALERAITERLPDPEDVDVVVPVPIHRARLIDRGFDQAGLLAKAVARALRRPLSFELVARVIDTPQLAALDAAGRKATVRDAFRARPDARGRRVLLIDDVRTTGATLDAVAAAVLDAGGSVRAHVLAATPKG